MAPTALVLGGTGMLGHRMVAALAETHDVHATVRDAQLARRAALRATVRELDVAAADAGAVLDVVAPELVVNCVGIVKQLDEAKHPIPSIRINALFPHELAEACARTGARLVHVSTDCVFSGGLPHPGAYTEADTPDARDLYGRTKLLGEVPAPALTLRTSIIGPELRRGTGLYEWFRRQGDDAVVQGFRQAWFSGLTTDAFARVVVEVAQDHPRLSGLYHVSADPISKHDLLVGLRDALGASCEIAGVDEPRVNRVLDSSRFRQQTGISIPSWEEMLGHYRKESHVETA
jgi:dTDP-4-dehydrorhamnose reductase